MTLNDLSNTPSHRSRRSRTPLKTPPPHARTAYTSLLSPNDDKRERSITRLNRKRSLGRKSSTHGLTESTETEQLSKVELIELYSNCIKLATDNVSYDIP